MKGSLLCVPGLNHETVKTGRSILTQLQICGSAGVKSVHGQSAEGAESINAAADLTLTASMPQQAAMLKRADASMSQAAQIHTGSSETTPLQLYSQLFYYIFTLNLQYFNK